MLEKKGSESEGKESCNELDSSSTLITIESTEEQNFLSKLLLKHNEISDNAWIGLESKTRLVQGSDESGEVNKIELEDTDDLDKKSYKWVNGKSLKYDNWDENADKSKDCVQMSLTKSSAGKWRDDYCNKKYLIVCEKRQWTQTTMNEEIKEMSKYIKKQARDLKDQKTLIADLRNQLVERTKVKKNDSDCPLPIGFVYTQLPEQLSPEELCPSAKWTEVSAEYEGLFFRVIGEDSAPFGEPQEMNQKTVSKVSLKGMNFNFFQNYGYVKEYKEELEDGWTQVKNKDNVLIAVLELDLKTSGGEVRPRNTAIKLWKRTE